MAHPLMSFLGKEIRFVGNGEAGEHVNVKGIIEELTFDETETNLTGMKLKTPFGSVEFEGITYVNPISKIVQGELKKENNL